MEATAPRSANCTSLEGVGTPLFVQLAAVDQLVFTPAGLQVFRGTNTEPTFNVNVLVTAVTRVALGGFVSTTTEMMYVPDGVKAVVVTVKVVLLVLLAFGKLNVVGFTDAVI